MSETKELIKETFKEAYENAIVVLVEREYPRWKEQAIRAGSRVLYSPDLSWAQFWERNLEWIGKEKYCLIYQATLRIQKKASQKQEDVFHDHYPNDCRVS